MEFQYESSGNKIYQFRKMLGLNKSQFGQIFDVSYMSVKNWESGTHDYPARILRIIRKNFHVNMDFFLRVKYCNLYTNMINFQKDKKYINKILKKER